MFRGHRSDWRGVTLSTFRCLSWVEQKWGNSSRDNNLALVGNQGRHSLLVFLFLFLSVPSSLPPPLSRLTLSLLSVFEDDLESPPRFKHLWCWDYGMAYLLDTGNQCVGHTKQAIYQLNYILSLSHWMEYRRVTWTFINWCLSSLKLGIVIFWGKMQFWGQKKPCLHWGSGLPLSVSLEHVAHQERALEKSPQCCKPLLSWVHTVLHCEPAERHEVYAWSRRGHFGFGVEASEQWLSTCELWPLWEQTTLSQGSPKTIEKHR